MAIKYLRILRRIFGGILLTIGILLTSGCARSGFDLPPEPIVNNLQISPNNYCSGEQVYFIWDVTHLQQNATKLQLRTYNDQVLLQINNPSDIGREVILNFNLDNFNQFKIRGFYENEHKEWTFIYHVRNIDNHTWVFPYTSSRETKEPTVIRELYATNNGINEYEVYQMFTGFLWEIPSEDFHSRAKCDRIQNLSMDRLIFRVGEEQITLDPFQIGTIANPIHPAGNITAAYELAEKKFLGIQIGEFVKDPPDENYQWYPVYQEEKAGIRLRVFCDTN